MTLSLSLELRASDPPAGEAVLTNRGEVPIRIWNTGNEWGDGALSFTVTVDGGDQHVALRPQLYTRNVPSFVELAPGGEERRPFDLGDGTWEPAVAGGDRLAAEFRIDGTPESDQHAVWTGSVRSEPVDLASPGS